MKSKTLKLINSTLKILAEQGEDPTMDPSMADPNAQAAPPAAPTEPPMPMTSQVENDYIKDIVDAALFKPSPEQSVALANLQSIMDLKRYKNARQEILPIVLPMIRTKSDDGDLRANLDEIS